MREKLKELLDYQISGLLTKIDEEMHSANSDADNWLIWITYISIYKENISKNLIINDKILNHFKNS